MTDQERRAWFREAAFGMFIHWGAYAVLGRGEWVMFQEKIPAREYRELGFRFKPGKYDPHQWALLAKRAGMRYMVLTTRHHDGYSLFDSKVSDFTAPKTGPGRDLIAEYVAGCRKAGLKVGFYYSLGDWRYPGFWRGRKDPSAWKEHVDYVHAQLEELMTGYGRIDILWYDGGFFMDETENIRPTTAEDWRSVELNAMIRKHQPHILINNRSGLPEDFDTPEGHITASAPGRLWESCMTMNKHWGYMKEDDEWKTPRTLVHNLTACATGGGNYLLNVGPKPDGTIPRESVKRLEAMGAWLERNGGAIYGVGAGSLDTGTAGCSADRGKKTYIFVHWWPGETLALPKVTAEIKSVRFLVSGEKIAVERKGNRLFLKNLPKKAPDPLTTVIVLETS